MGNVLITTTSAESVRPKQILGLVQVWSIRSRNAFSDVGGALKGIVGGRQGGQEKALLSASNEVLKDLEKKALSIGADAVVETRINVTSILISSAPSIIYHVYGTAVKY